MKRSKMRNSRAAAFEVGTKLQKKGLFALLTEREEVLVPKGCWLHRGHAGSISNSTIKCTIKTAIRHDGSIVCASLVALDHGRAALDDDIWLACTKRSMQTVSHM